MSEDNPRLMIYQYTSTALFRRGRTPSGKIGIGRDVHGLLEVLQVFMLLAELFLQLCKLVLLALADFVILVGLLSLVESVAISEK